MQIDAQLNLIQDLAPTSAPTTPSAPPREFSDKLDQRLDRGGPPPDSPSPTGPPPHKVPSSGEATSNEPNAQENQLDSSPDTTDTEEATEPFATQATPVSGQFIVPQPVAPNLTVALLQLGSEFNPVVPIADGFAPVSATPVSPQISLNETFIVTSTPSRSDFAPELVATQLAGDATADSKVAPGHVTPDLLPASDVAPTPNMTTLVADTAKVAVGTQLADSQATAVLNPLKIETDVASAHEFPEPILSSTAPSAPEMILKSVERPGQSDYSADVMPTTAKLEGAHQIPSADVTNGSAQTDANSSSTAPMKPGLDTVIPVDTPENAISEHAKAPSQATPQAIAQKQLESSIPAVVVEVPEANVSVDDPQVSDDNSSQGFVSSVFNVPVMASTKAAVTVTQNTTESALTENPDRVTQQVMDKLDGILASRKHGSVTIHLEPRELGSIIVTVRQFGVKLEADIQTTNDQARQQLDAGRMLLQQSLESKGVTLTNFNVDSQGNLQHNHSQQNQHALQREDFQRTMNLRSSERDKAPATPAARVIDRSRAVDLVI